MTLLLSKRRNTFLFSPFDPQSSDCILFKRTNKINLTISRIFTEMNAHVNLYYKICHFRYIVWSSDRCRLVSCPDQNLRTISRAKNLRGKGGGSFTRATLSTRIRINDDTRFTSICRDTNGSMLENLSHP